MLTEERKHRILSLCKELVSIKSYSGEEGSVAQALKSYMLSNGYDDVLIDKYGNVIGKICGNRPGKKLLFDGHMDTVPVGNENDWTHDPFKPEVVDGKLYGRGTTDMKGAVSAFTVAAVFFCEDMKKDFAGEIYIAGLCGDWGGLSFEFKNRSKRKSRNCCGNIR